MIMKSTNNLKRPLIRHPAGIISLFFLAFFTLGGCNQDAIFHYISEEVELLEPRIKGSPTDIVPFKNYLYVANQTSLYRYGPGTDQNPVWDTESLVQPGREIRALAATANYLYALTGGTLKRWGGGTGEWVQVVIDADDSEARQYPYLQTIHGDSQRLFVGSSNGYPLRDSANHAILYADETANQLKTVKTEVSLLTGAAFDGTNTFLSTSETGIYAVSFTSGAPVVLGDGTPIAKSDDPNNKYRTITGIITLGNNTIVAIDREGDILAVTETSFTVRGDVGKYTTGALALWRGRPVPGETFEDADHPDIRPPKLLLVGVQGSLSSTVQTYSNGYREIMLNESTGGLGTEIPVDDPGYNAVSSIAVSDREKYTTSLERLPINHFFQTPYVIDKTMTLFASTHNGKEGLWSYRERNGEWQWNAEE
jgi:hypothetical protein